ncbi:MAG TPA: phosphotransferase [Gemmatimonadaceae bacterium]|nr:phosphotransferase [Gemmatimonadaceae bacterium]
MSTSSFEAGALRHLLPESVVGEVTLVTPIHLGLSGAGVWAVTSARGEYVLRVQGDRADGHSWTQQLLVLRRAAECGIAPAVVHVDEAARAVVSARVAGVPLPAALGDPAQRTAAIAGVVAQLRALHAVDPAGVEERDAVDYARRAWAAQRARPGFPSWAAGVGDALDAIATWLARDPRRVVGHNDVNPGNVLWDGARAWLVDWEVAGLAHPYYDVAALATFLALDADAANGLLALQERAPLDDDARATFAALRRLVALVAGCTFLGLVPDLAVFPAPTRAEAPTMHELYAALRTGAYALQEPRGRAAFGLALLRVGTEAT